MIDFGVYKIQQDNDNGIYVLTEQISGERQTFVSIQELVEYFQGELEEIKRSLYRTARK